MKCGKKKINKVIETGLKINLKVRLAINKKSMQSRGKIFKFYLNIKNYALIYFHNREQPSPSDL